MAIGIAGIKIGQDDLQMHCPMRARGRALSDWAEAKLYEIIDKVNSSMSADACVAGAGADWEEAQQAFYDQPPLEGLPAIPP
ncbi:hypothetical protein P6U16_23125 (plasmid) [Rhizobium sp. 32-5/1]|uniref:hypothetical protein n=1 Tax=Rhizobium sp. 32-5/1 TaxID=3019602 RepID=UPI00240E4766|nr:hypothetical protein [Rhizobium sp. 32-5/1]WEZ85885.1 hypothetical protein P6U16_23125 [Rhizobium sp. 32-5/1]